MFSQEPHCTYRKSPLADVICQLRYPEILMIAAQSPAAFQEAIRHTFPKYDLSKVPQPGQQEPIVNHRFASLDGKWQVNLTSKFLSLTCSEYHNWEEFAKMLDLPLAAFIKTYAPSCFERVGLRYLNFVSRRDLDLEGVPFRELFQPCYLGILAEDDVNEAGTTRCCVDVELNLPGGCKGKIHAGPGLVRRNGQQDPEIKFVFDQDLSMSSNVPVQYSAGALHTLHAQSFPIFRGAVTDRLHEAMEPIDE